MINASNQRLDCRNSTLMVVHVASVLVDQMFAFKVTLAGVLSEPVMHDA